MPDNDPGVLARVKFLLDAAEYFERRDTHGEDKAHWSNVYNAKNCRDIATYLESRSPVGVTVGEPALTRLEVTDEMVERAAKAFSAECDRMAVEDGVEDIPTWDAMTEESRAHFRRCTRVALQASEGCGSPTSPKQTSELEEAEAIGCGGLK